jgi:predicted transcriptional regulator of viral defense system
MSNNPHMKGKKDALNGWLETIQANGRYTFTRADLEREGPVVERTSVWRAQRDGRLIQPRTGFFVIVPIEYRAVGAPPVEWFIDNLMRFEQVPYYVGLLSAASLHGASPQAVQEFQVIVPEQRRPVRAGRLRLHFIVRSDHQKAATEQRQTPTGSMRIATPEQTALDLVRYPIAAGGWDNIASVVRDLAPVINPAELENLARMQEDVRPIQRLGYLFDAVAHAEVPARALAASLVRRAPRYVALEPKASTKNAKRDERWHLLINRVIEAD